jgi:hypothetical protein
MLLLFCTIGMVAEAHGQQMQVGELHPSIAPHSQALFYYCTVITAFTDCCDVQPATLPCCHRQPHHHHHVTHSRHSNNAIGSLVQLHMACSLLHFRVYPGEAVLLQQRIAPLLPKAMHAKNGWDTSGRYTHGIRTAATHCMHAHACMHAGIWLSTIIATPSEMGGQFTSTPNACNASCLITAYTL